MDYFGDAETLPKGCGRCDNCQTPEASPVDDKTQETVRILLSGAARLEGRFGGSQLADLVTGSDTVQIRKYNHQHLPTYGRLSSLPKRQVSAHDSGAHSPGISAARGITISGPGHHRDRPRGHARSRASAAGLMAARPCTEGPQGAVDPPAGVLASASDSNIPTCARHCAIGVRASPRRWESRPIRYSGTERSTSYAPGFRPLRLSCSRSGASANKSSVSSEQRFSP